MWSDHRQYRKSMFMKEETVICIWNWIRTGHGESRVNTMWDGTGGFRKSRYHYLTGKQQLDNTIYFPAIQNNITSTKPWYEESAGSFCQVNLHPWKLEAQSLPKLKDGLLTTCLDHGNLWGHLARNELTALYGDILYWWKECGNLDNGYYFHPPRFELSFLS